MRPSEPSTGRVPPAAALGRPVRILLVEDSEADVRLTRTALERAHADIDLRRAHNGLEALEMLRDPAAVRPDLVLLDLNMPRMDGRELLAELKADPALRRIPVIVLTTSAEEGDVLSAYDRSVAGYVTKPVDFNDFVASIEALERFWLNVVHYSP